MRLRLLLNFLIIIFCLVIPVGYLSNQDLDTDISNGNKQTAKVAECSPDNLKKCFELPQKEPVCDPSASGKCQKVYGDIAWNTFIALNWPADFQGGPDKTSMIGTRPNAKRVWEFFKYPDEVFSSTEEVDISLEPKEEGRPPSFLITGEVLPQGSSQNEIPKVEEDNFRQASPEYPVIDQEGRYVVYGIRINEVESNQIKDNHWYNRNCFGNGLSIAVGAIEIKTAWKILDSANSKQNPPQYYTVHRKYTIPKEYVINDGKQAQSDLSQDMNLGLIGFHIFHKVKNSGSATKSEWIMSTFEHINNTPVDPKNPDQGTNYALYKPCNKGKKVCRENEPPEGMDSESYRVNTDLKAMTSQNTFLEPTQVVRLPAPSELSDKVIKELNDRWQTALKEAGIWQNYRLIGVQWTTGIGSALGNPAIETYIQYTKNPSCLGCHSQVKHTTDYSFLITDKAKRRDSACPPPKVFN